MGKMSNKSSIYVTYVNQHTELISSLLHFREMIKKRYMNGPPFIADAYLCICLRVC